MSFEYFAAPGVLDAAKKLAKDAYDTLVVEYPDRDPRTVWAFVTSEFDALQRSNQVVTTDAIVSKYRLGIQ